MLVGPKCGETVVPGSITENAALPNRFPVTADGKLVIVFHVIKIMADKLAASAICASAMSI